MAKRYISLKVLKENRAEILEDVLIALVLGLAFVGLSSIVVSNPNVGEWLGDIAPLFIGLTSVYVAFSVLSVSLEENRKQAKQDRDLAIRPLLVIKPYLGQYKDSDENRMSLKVFKEGDRVYDAFWMSAVNDKQLKIYLVNVGLEPSVNITLVARIGNQLFTAANPVNQIDKEGHQLVHLIYNEQLLTMSNLYTVYQDIYGNFHAVENFFDIKSNSIKFVSSQYLAFDDEATHLEVTEFVRKSPMFYY